jgi:hypothetical protein
VDSGYIGKALPIWPGRRRGMEWSYEENAALRLRTLHRLQKAGYRGKTLSFSLWWMGIIDFNEKCREYILGMVAGLKERLDRSIAKSLNRSAKAEEKETGISGPQVGIPSAEAISIWLSGHHKMREVSRELDLEIRRLVPRVSVDAGLYEPFIAAMAASLMGIPAREVDGLDPDLNGVVEPLLGNLTGGDKAIFKELLHHFELPEFMRIFIGAIDQMPASGFEASRATMRRRRTEFAKIRKLIAAEQRAQAKISNRRRSRVGPWRNPPAAYRAAAVGIAIGIAEVLRRLGFSTEIG